MNPGIYLHVPFCYKKCNYCSFYSITDFEAILPLYRESVIRDIQELPLFFASCKKLPDTLYIGGGTPSILPLKEWEFLLPCILDRYSFQEITLEVNPGTIDEEKICGYSQSGINRLSIGIQSLEDDILFFLGRIHNRKQALASIEMARKSFSNFSVDILFAIPLFPSICLENTTRCLVENYFPPHISAYCLTIEPGTPFFEKNVAPNEEQFEREYYWLHDYLTSQGYIHYEVSNYALPGFLSKHNSKYWTRVPYLGIGPAAHSLWNEKRFACESIEDFFQNSLSQKEANAMVLSQEEIHTERIMLGARTQEGILLSDIQTPEQKLLRLEQSGLIKIEEEKLILTLKGWMVMNSVILEIL